MAEVGRSLRFLNIVFAIWLIAASIILKNPSGIENMEGNKKMMGSMMKDGKMMGTMKEHNERRLHTIQHKADG